MGDNVGFRVTVEFDCLDMIDEKTFYEKYKGCPVAAYKIISNNFEDSPLDFCDKCRVTNVALLPKCISETQSTTSVTMG